MGLMDTIKGWFGGDKGRVHGEIKTGADAITLRKDYGQQREDPDETARWDANKID